VTAPEIGMDQIRKKIAKEKGFFVELKPEFFYLPAYSLRDSVMYP
jgi:hypothetical protein